MAEKFNVSSRYLSDLLKQETGKTALELIHTHLIKEAKNLLAESKLNISEISFSLGFENPNYFARLFKREVGIPPNAFRDNSLNYFSFQRFFLPAGNWGEPRFCLKFNQ